MGPRPWELLRERLRFFATWESLRGCTGRSINTIISGTVAILAVFHPALRNSDLADDGEILRIKRAANKHNPSSKRPTIPWEKLIFEDLYRHTTRTDARGIPIMGPRVFLTGSAAWAMFNLLARPGAIVPPGSDPYPTIFRDSAVIVAGSRYILLSGADGGPKMDKEEAEAGCVKPPLDFFWDFWRRTISVSFYGRVDPALTIEMLFDDDFCDEGAIFDWDGVIVQNEVNALVSRFLRSRFNLSKEEAARLTVRGARTGCASYLKSLGWTVNEIAAVCLHKNPAVTRIHYLRTSNGRSVKTKKVKIVGDVIGKPWVAKFLVSCNMIPPAKSISEAVRRMKSGLKGGPTQRSKAIAARSRGACDPLSGNIFDSLREGKTRTRYHSSFC